jgi:hypothetical protein
MQSGIDDFAAMGQPKGRAWKASHFAISMDRQQLYWPEIDEDVNVPALLSFEPESAGRRDIWPDVTLRCCRCLEDRKPAQWKWDGLAVGQVEKQVCAVEVHVHRSAIHGHLRTRVPQTIGRGGLMSKESRGKQRNPATARVTATRYQKVFFTAETDALVLPAAALPEEYEWSLSTGR